MTAQFSLGLEGGNAPDPKEGVFGPPRVAASSAPAIRCRPAPTASASPHGPDGDGPPWTLCCGDGRAVAGHVPSRECAEAIVEALNRGVAL